MDAYYFTNEQVLGIFALAFIAMLLILAFLLYLWNRHNDSKENSGLKKFWKGIKNQEEDINSYH